MDLLTDKHKEGLTNFELKLTEVVSVLHGEFEFLKQQLEAAKLVGGTSPVTVRCVNTRLSFPNPKSSRVKGTLKMLRTSFGKWKTTLNTSTLLIKLPRSGYQLCTWLTQPCCGGEGRKQRWKKVVASSGTESSSS